MRRDLIDKIACPRDGDLLSLVTHEDGFDVREGELICQSDPSHTYPIRSSIADFRDSKGQEADKFAVEEAAEFGAIPTKAVARKLSKISAEWWLDAGCGRAAYRRSVSGRYIGVDIVQPFLVEAKSRAPDCDFIAADIRQLPFIEDAFDVVVASQVIEHLTSSGLGRVLREFKRVTRGAIIVDTPNESAAIAALRRLLYKERTHQVGSPLDHYSHLTAAILRRQGFHVEGCVGHVTRNRFAIPVAWDLVDLIARWLPSLGGNLIGTLGSVQSSRPHDRRDADSSLL